jgi:hypothetical protein
MSALIAAPVQFAVQRRGNSGCDMIVNDKWSKGATGGFDTLCRPRGRPRSFPCVGASRPQHRAAARQDGNRKAALFAGSARMLYRALLCALLRSRRYCERDQIRLSLTCDKSFCRRAAKNSRRLFRGLMVRLALTRPLPPSTERRRCLCAGRISLWASSRAAPQRLRTRSAF